MDGEYGSGEADGKILAKNQNSVVVKWPSRSVSINMLGHRQYVPARTVVYSINETRENGELEVTPLIEWDNTRSKKQE